MDEIAVIEQAMVAIRRSQRRRTLAGMSGATAQGAVFDVLDVVEAAEHAGEPATVSAVAMALGVDQPRASRLVAAAVEAGLIRREADQADGRRALLVRTPGGIEMSDQAHGFRRGMIERAVSGWTGDDRSALAHLLARFMTDFARVTSAGPNRTPDSGT
ncbi:winged helix-turn-helix transcriptional regulator [Microtetraspora sp. AC03309]|uniref:MarR family winged helix-turn-helix transcriptional regulator n=1 Tax=Microtetraspora sp. AC03309 TaxID=2779376 RepID=UPI001E377F99|nr:MarR family winged helix-turn-helix transcriptional regulator [Microtetraspora sp. AC03309]MCC5577971.1 winged helix-turn-helix transcriptional regulator [Microtetraspora sp. AC03309]